MIAVVYPEQGTADEPVYQRNNKGNLKIYGKRDDVLRAFQCRSEEGLMHRKGAAIVELSKKEVRSANNRT